MTERTNGRRPDYKKLDGGIYEEKSTAVRPRHIDHHSRRITRSQSRTISARQQRSDRFNQNRKDEDGTTLLTKRLATMDLISGEDNSELNTATGGNEDGRSSDADSTGNGNTTVIQKSPTHDSPLRSVHDSPQNSVIPAHSVHNSPNANQPSNHQSAHQPKYQSPLRSKQQQERDAAYFSPPSNQYVTDPYANAHNNLNQSNNEFSNNSRSSTPKSAATSNIFGNLNFPSFNMPPAPFLQKAPGSMPFNVNLTNQPQFNSDGSQLLAGHDHLMRQVRAAEEERLLRQKLEDEKAERMRQAMKRQEEERRNRERDQLRHTNTAHIQHSSQADQEINQIKCHAASIADDIDDFIDEHPSDDIGSSIADIDAIIYRMEKFRSEFREKHNHLKLHLAYAYPSQLENACDTTLGHIKQYLFAVRAKRKSLRDNEETEKNASLHVKKEKLNFMITEVIRSMVSLQNIFSADLEDLTDEEVTTRKSNLADQVKTLQSIPKSIQEIIDTGGDEAQIKDIKDRYETLLQTNATYVVDLDEEITDREIHKRKKFDQSTLNINIPKFEGYSAVYDVYTFQDDFEKVHLKSTPRSLLPDLLKNRYLEGSALSLVKDLKDIDLIWTRLKEGFGDSKLLLTKKLSQFNNMEHLGRIKDNSKSVDVISKIINLMKDLMQLTKRHNIENHLYFGDCLERIYRLMGDGRINRWLGQKDDRKEGEELWLQLIGFLERELKVHQQKVLIFAQKEVPRKDDQDKDKKDRDKPRNKPTHHNNQDGHNQNSSASPTHNSTMCAICGEADHVQTLGPRGMKLVQYFVCKKWAEMKNSERLEVLKAKGLCFQCLFPGADVQKGKHATGQCQRDFTCPHPSHDNYTPRKHILVCAEHKDNKENKDLLEKFKNRCILKRNQANLPSHAKDIGFVGFVGSMFVSKEPDNEENHLDHDQSVPAIQVDRPLPNSEFEHSHAPSPCQQDTHYNHPYEFVDSADNEAVYMLQTIQIDNQSYNLFYDTGCGGFLSRHEAVLRLKKRAIQLVPGNFEMRGVGNASANAGHGIYGVEIPLANGGVAKFQGGCMDVITERFPEYPLKGEIEKDIHEIWVSQGNTASNLPTLPESIGGDTDFMLGSRYRKFFPIEIFRTPSGLSICESMFKNPDGTRGVICGPHELITRIDRQYGHYTRSFLDSQRKLYLSGYHVNPDVQLLGHKDELLDEDEMVDVPRALQCYHAPRGYRKFVAVEMAGSEISYRCPDCRSCSRCKNHEQIEAVSIKEEVQQDQIEKSVHIDTTSLLTTASLPLLDDPATKLAPNSHKALKTYQQQVKKLAKNPQDKQAAIDSERKLQDLGYVAWVKDLPADVQKTLGEHPVQNFLPWRICFKENSPTTPARLVFDGSQPTDSGFCINDIVPKGTNMLNKLCEMFMAWRVFKSAFHCDIRKMYNAISLHPEYWCLQRYWFQEDLDPRLAPEEKIIMTIIYGVRSSGNQAQCAVRKLAEMFAEQFPSVFHILSKLTYMDDCMGGEDSDESSEATQDNLEYVLRMGGFKLKGFTVSGKDPPKDLARDDGVSINVAGMVWYPREDLISLDIKELNFAKKQRGKKPIIIKEVPENLTKRHCASKLGEVFDLTGLVTPLIAGMKMDLHELNVRKLHWDDVLPNELQAVWHSHFEMMQEIKDVRFERAVVPSDAVDLNATTLDFGDASKSLICIAIYIRFKRTNGEHSCQLFFSRSRIVPDGMTQPRAEAYAAFVNAHSGEVVRRSLGDHHTGALKFTDSQIVLYWITKNDQILKEWVRNRIIEIHRFTSINQWYYVESQDMIADIGTRRCYSTSVVSPDSVWIQGYEWMKGDEADFPMMTPEEVTLNNNEIQNMKKEVKENTFKMSYVVDGVKYAGKRLKPIKEECEDFYNRYQFSNYVYDPNTHRFTASVRILALVYRFIRKLKAKKPRSQLTYDPPESLVISAEDIASARNYFFQKATLEVQHFCKKPQYENLSKEVNGILTYSGRILPDDDISILGRATKVMTDLGSSTFCVPLAEKRSPVAFAIASDVHWSHPTAKHCGVDTVWRYILKEVFILEGRSLVARIGKDCERCRYLNKKKFEVAMGPVSPHNLNIAPAFYVTQTDIAGPFDAHCHHHKRNTIKVWLLIFCCATTSTTNIKVMGDYSTTSFVLAFIRFSTEVGYPNTMLCDKGSQLVKGCESMVIEFLDLKRQLHRECGVNFEVCPVGGHNMNGRVERKIREVRKSIAKSFQHEKLSIIQWETLGASVANTINNMPLALGNTRSNLEALDLLTPNRLKLGRNNERSPVGCVCVDHVDRIIEQNENVFNSWFEMWLTVHVPKLISQPKWFKSHESLKPGDVVLFLKNEGSFSANDYHYGMIDSVVPTRDGKIRKVVVRYHNADDNRKMYTERAARSLAVIHRVDETSMMEEIDEAWRMAEMLANSTSNL